MTHPKRGEVYWVNFDPAVGGEVKRTRPAVVLSNDVANQHLNRIIVVPVTSKIERVYPAEALISIGDKQSKAMADQMTAASKLRLGRKLGQVSREDMERIEAAIAIHLGLSRIN